MTRANQVRSRRGQKGTIISLVGGIGLVTAGFLVETSHIETTSPIYRLGVVIVAHATTAGLVSVSQLLAPQRPGGQGDHPVNAIQIAHYISSLEHTSSIECFTIEVELAQAALERAPKRGPPALPISQS